MKKILFILSFLIFYSTTVSFSNTVITKEDHIKQDLCKIAQDYVRRIGKETVLAYARDNFTPEQQKKLDICLKGIR